jgi:predicted DNA binding CopG/RHH family protein
MVKNSQANYYEETDFTDVMKNKHGKKVAPIVKRITMNISERVYNEANELDSYLGMGYQNVLKTAMTLGLTDLYNQVSSHKLPGK